MKLQDIAIVRKYRRDHFSIVPGDKFTVKRGDVIVHHNAMMDKSSRVFIAKEDDDREVSPNDTIVRVTSENYSPDAIATFLIYSNAFDRVAKRERLEMLEVPELTQQEIESINQVNKLIELRQQQMKLFDELKMSIVHHAMKRGAK